MFLSSLNRAEYTGLRVLERGRRERKPGYVISEFLDVIFVKYMFLQSFLNLC